MVTASAGLHSRGKFHRGEGALLIIRSLKFSAISRKFHTRSQELVQLDTGSTICKARVQSARRMHTAVYVLGRILRDSEFRYVERSIRNKSP